MSQPKKPRVSDVVLYYPREGQTVGAERAAIITGTNHALPTEGDPTPRPNYNVALTVFPNRMNPSLHEEQHRDSAPYDATGKPGTWRYREDAEPGNAADVRETEKAKSPAPATEPAAAAAEPKKKAEKPAKAAPAAPAPAGGS